MTCVVDTDIFRSAVLFLISAVSSASLYLIASQPLLPACACRHSCPRLQAYIWGKQGRVISPFLLAPSLLTSHRSISSWEWELISRGRARYGDCIWQCLPESRQHHCLASVYPPGNSWYSCFPNGTCSPKNVVIFLGIISNGMVIFL